MTISRSRAEVSAGSAGGSTSGIGSAPAWITFLAAILLTIPAMGSGVLWGDVAITRFIQGINVSGISGLAEAVNWVGAGAQVIVLTLCLAVVLCAVRRYAAAAFVTMTTLIHLANGGLKAFADSPRPTADLVTIREYANGLGFPSGHAMGVMLFYGALLLIARDCVSQRRLRVGIQVFAVGMTLATGFGRVYAGAHWPSDVLGGYLWGLAALFGLRRAFPEILVLSPRAWFGVRARFAYVRGARLDAQPFDD